MLTGGKFKILRESEGKLSRVTCVQFERKLSQIAPDDCQLEPSCYLATRCNSNRLTVNKSASVNLKKKMFSLNESFDGTLTQFFLQIK